MKASKMRGGNLAIAGVLVVVLFLPMVGALTGTGPGIAYGQARGPDVERFFSAECAKLRGDLQRESEWLDFARHTLAMNHRTTEIYFELILDSLADAKNLRDQIAGLDAAAVFIATGDTRVSGLLQAMRKKAEARLTERKKQYEIFMDRLSESIRLEEEDEADVKKRERTVADLRRKSSAAGCDLPPLGSLISFLPAPSALGAPLPPARPPTPPPTPTTQVPGSVTRVPPKQPAPGARAGSLQLVEVKADPSCETWPRDCTSNPNGGWITQHHDYGGGVFYEARYQWNDPPRQVGPEGFTITMSASAQSAPRSSLAAGMSMVGGGFELTPGGTFASFQVLSENASAQTKSLTVTVKPPKNPSGDYYLRIGANYYAGFVYHYRVVR